VPGLRLQGFQHLSALVPFSVPCTGGTDTTGGTGGPTAIGGQADTAVAKGWAGHEVLDLPAKEWSIAGNDQWVQSVVSTGTTPSA
jgi:hypothetical protein